MVEILSRRWKEIAKPPTSITGVVTRLAAIAVCAGCITEAACLVGGQDTQADLFAYEQYRAGVQSIGIMDASRGLQATVVEGNYRSPVWLPNGTLVVQSTDPRTAGSDLVLLNPFLGTQRLLTKSESFDTVFVLHPDLEHFGYLTNFGDNPLVRDIALAHFDDPDTVRQLTHSGEVTKFGWSANGRYLAYLEGISEKQTIILDTQTGQEVRVLPAATYFAWSPTAECLAYSPDNGGLSIMQFAPTLEMKQVSSLSTSRFVWSPDGTQLAFMSSLDPGNNVYEKISVFEPSTGETQNYITRGTSLQALYFGRDALYYSGFSQNSSQTMQRISPNGLEALFFDRYAFPSNVNILAS